MEEFPPDFKFMLSVPEAIHHTPEGPIVEVRSITNIEDAEDRKAVLAKSLGVDIDRIGDRDSSSNTPRGKFMVGFRKWRSTWDPKAEIDPNLN